MAKGERFDPRLAEFFDAEESVLTSRLRGIRAAISHGGEKGRTVEAGVAALLREFLPAEYGIGTGFIAYHDASCIRSGKYDASADKVRLSDQVDIIIYDALRGGPLAKLGSCGVFPLEAVYAYVEVKTAITSPGELTALLHQSDQLRSMRVRIYRFVVPGQPTWAEERAYGPESTISIRSYVVVMDGKKLGTGQEIQRKLQDASKRYRGKNTFLSGLYINEKGFFYHRPVDRKDDPRVGDVLSVLMHPLLTLKNSLYSNLSRYPRAPEGATSAIDLYAREPQIVPAPTDIGDKDPS